MGAGCRAAAMTARDRHDFMALQSRCAQILQGFRQFFMANQAKAGAILRFLAKMGYECWFRRSDQ